MKALIMSDYSSQLEQVKNARSLDEINRIVSHFDPKSTVYDGILYSRDVGNTSSGLIANASQIFPGRK